MSGCEEDQKSIELILSLFQYIFITIVKSNDGYTKLFEKLTKTYLKSDANPVTKACVIDYTKVMSLLDECDEHENTINNSYVVSKLHELSEQNQIDTDLMVAHYSEIQKLLLSVQKNYCYDHCVLLCEVYPKWLEDNASVVSGEDAEKHRRLFDILKELKTFVDTYRVFDMIEDGTCFNENEHKMLAKIFDNIVEFKLPSAESMESVRRRLKKVNETEFFQTCSIM